MFRRACIILLTVAAIATAIQWGLSYFTRINWTLALNERWVCHVTFNHARYSAYPMYRTSVQLRVGWLLGAAHPTQPGRPEEGLSKEIEWIPDGLWMRSIGTSSWGSNRPTENSQNWTHDAGLILMREMAVANVVEFCWSPHETRYTVTNPPLGGTLRMHLVFLPTWLVFIAFASYPTIAFIRGPMRRWRRRSTGRCLGCGYDLTANVSGICPECGAIVPADRALIAAAPRAHYDHVLMRWVADFAYLLAGLAFAPIALFNALVVGKNRRGWRQRFGAVPRFEAGRERVWVHAVSLGEINATPKLVEAIRERRPGIDVVISTTTDTGFARAVQLHGAERVFRYPFDFSLVVSTVLRRIRPTMIVLVELEVWYNLVRMADARGIPVVVVNGRLTARSARRFGKLGALIRPMFRSLSWVGAQDEPIAERFAALGVPRDRIDVTSSLKWDSALVADEVPGSAELSRALGLPPERPVWVCGSTGPGEEEMVLDAYRKMRGARSSSTGVVQAPSVLDRPARPPTPSRGEGEKEASPPAPSQEEGEKEALPAPSRVEGESGPILVIVPRKPERFDEVARMIERTGFGCVRRSSHPDGEAPAVLGSNDVVLGDTMGELRKFYSLADVVFVGRSLVAMGGSDPMEVAALAKPVVVGLHMENFRDAVDALKRRDAVVTVNDREELAQAVGGLLADRVRATTMGRAAREVVKDNQGATQTTVDALERLWPNGAKEK